MIGLDKIKIAIPIGDPLGIGPEIAIKALANKEIFKVCQPLLVGSKEVLYKAAKLVNMEETFLKHENLIIDVYTDVNLTKALAGQAAYMYIEEATKLCLGKSAKAMATAPINKENLRAANIDFIGHTEILAHLTNTQDPLTMFETHELRIFFLSRHVSLKEACKLVKRERLENYIEKSCMALKRIGVEKGPLAVAGLNPHSGDGGLFGKEEIYEIIPAIRNSQLKGLKVVGPISADSVFHLAKEGKYSGVLSLYHDQGHIAAKTLDFYKTISLTIGLPFLRTSVDHGTASDIAWQGIANETSMAEAILKAAQYGQNY